MLLLLLPAAVRAHGAVVTPLSRNAVDKDLLPWSGPVPAHPPTVENGTGWCPVPGEDGAPSGKNGQACFWFSNGCSIGCHTCDGSSRGPIPNRHDPFWRRKFNTCPDGVNSTATATVCDPAKRTVNTGAVCGAHDDWFYYSPWRRPGTAPVLDSCGVAGGHQPPDGGFGGVYVNTTHARLGDLGSAALPQMAPQARWTAGELVEVSWTIEANHGGGYLYRLCRAELALNEECFDGTPLAFEGAQTLRWGGRNGTEVDLAGTYVAEGTWPPGSRWVKNPIPRNDHRQTGAGFAPPCADARRCSGMTDGATADPTLEIVDRVRIPPALPAGRYVLGWRWDCEESNQIWASCSDVEVVVAGATS